MYYSAKNGVRKRIESWEVVVPLFDNEQQQYPEKAIELIRAKIIHEFGALTSFNVVGYWKSGGRIFFDKSITIIVDVPVKEHKKALTFFLDLKEQLRKDLRQEKVYVTFKKGKAELLSTNEFLQELGFEIPVDQAQPLTQDNIDKLVGQADVLQKRLSYKTLSLRRNRESRKIIWEREILGIKISTEVDDDYPDDAVILPADNLEFDFPRDAFERTIIVIGDYEYQSYILDKEKRRYVVGDPSTFAKYDKGDKEPLYGPHEWHGMLQTSEFIPTFVEEILINYIVLRESGIRKREITISVGSDGSMQFGGGKLAICPAMIPEKWIQRVIIANLRRAVRLYESGTIDEIALMQAKVLNRYNEKKAMLKSYARISV